MKLVKTTNWDEVFEGWASREERDPGWMECATKIKGWPDWRSWRGFSATMLGLQKKIWKVFEIENPLEEIPNMLVGPYTGWQKRHPNTNLFTFSELLEAPEEYEAWSKNPKILDIIAHFPSETQFIALLREDINKIVCIEGHHRAVALALAKKDGLKVNIDGASTLALANLEKDETTLLEKALKRGSTKDPV